MAPAGSAEVLRGLEEGSDRSSLDVPLLGHGLGRLYIESPQPGAPGLRTPCLEAPGIGCASSLPCTKPEGHRRLAVKYPSSTSKLAEEEEEEIQEDEEAKDNQESLTGWMDPYSGAAFNDV